MSLKVLARLLAPKDARVAAAVELATKDPRRYAAKHRRSMEARNVEKADPWDALAEGLVESGVAFTVDWKARCEDIAAHLRKRVPAKAFAFYSEADHLQTSTPAFLALAGRALSAFGLALIALDRSSDHHTLAVIRHTQLARAVKLGEGKLRDLGPKKPLTTPLPAASPVKAKRLETLQFPTVFSVSPFVQTPGFTIGDDTSTGIVDCRTWPPKRIAVGGPRLKVAMHPRTGERLTCRDEVVRIGKHAISAGFEVRLAAWMGDVAVLLPTEAAVRSGSARRPRVWDGKTLVPAKGLPDVTAAAGTAKDRWPPFLRQGFAGSELLIWEGAAWRFEKGGFVRHGPPAPFIVPGPLVIGAGRYFLATKNRVTTVFDAEWKKCARFEGVTSGPPVPTPDGKLIFGMNRFGDAKAPGLGVFDPSTAQVTFIAGSDLGLRKDDQVDAYGFTRKGELWVLDAEELRRIG